jgi:hypothetical protein
MIKTRYYKGWQIDAELKGWKKYYRLFCIGSAIELGYCNPESIDRDFFNKWMKSK